MKRRSVALIALPIACGAACLLAATLASFRPVPAADVPGYYRAVRGGGFQDLYLKGDGTFEMGSSVGSPYRTTRGVWQYDDDGLYLNAGADQAGLGLGAYRHLGGGVYLYFGGD